MNEQNPDPTRYEAINWQNFGRRLTVQEFDEVRAKIAGLHFTKEAFSDDPIVMQALYAAEALQREVEILVKDNPFPVEDTAWENKFWPHPLRSANFLFCLLFSVLCLKFGVGFGGLFNSKLNIDVRN